MLAYKGAMSSVSATVSVMSYYAHPPQALEYLFKFIVQSRILYSRATCGLEEEQFRLSIQELFQSLRQVLSLDARTCDTLLFTQVMSRLPLLLCPVHMTTRPCPPPSPGTIHTTTTRPNLPPPGHVHHQQALPINRTHSSPSRGPAHYYLALSITPASNSRSSSSQSHSLMIYSDSFSINSSLTFTPSSLTSFSSSYSSFFSLPSFFSSSTCTSFSSSLSSFSSSYSFFSSSPPPHPLLLLLLPFLLLFLLFQIPQFFAPYFAPPQPNSGSAQVASSATGPAAPLALGPAPCHAPGQAQPSSSAPPPGGGVSVCTPLSVSR